MPYDLLLKGGHVLDPGRGIDAQMDIAVSDGRIAAIEPEIASADARHVLEVGGTDRHVVPGLIDMHTHIAWGAQTEGVGMGCCDPDEIGVQAGVTTVLDAGSVGVANVGVIAAHVIPKAKTRVLTYVNVGSYAHTMPGFADVNSIEDINRDAIARAVTANPGLINGVKLRMVGPIMNERGEEVVDLAKAIAAEHQIPLMVHIGDMQATNRPSPERLDELTAYLLRQFSEGDILTHLCTPHHGGVLDTARKPIPELAEAHANGVVLDSALGRGNFGYEIAAHQAQLGVLPDTISSDLTAGGLTFHSLTECMAKFMAIGYTLADVVRATTTNAAKAVGHEDSIGALAVGREADITVLDLVSGDYKFVDTIGTEFRGTQGLVPVQTVRAGELFAPRWGTHPWGWEPERA
jgi:dihydroorotase